MSSPYERLEDLLSWLEREIKIEDRPSYVGTQRVIAYNRVRRRLVPIVKQCRRIRREFDFQEKPDGTAAEDVPLNQ
jgi:hypothetical protein